MATKNFVVRNGLTVNDIDVIDANGNITATSLTVNGVEITGAGEVANAYLTSTYTTNTAFQSALANTNAYIATVEGNLFSGDYADLSNKPNLDQYLQVANADFFSGDYNDLTNKPNLGQYLQVANTAALVAPYLEVANAAATYATIDTVNSNLANTNAYIAYVAANAGEVSNAYLTSTFTTNTDFQSYVANTNAYIASVAASGGEVANAYLTSTFTTNTAFQSALANTNAYIASVAASGSAVGTTAYEEYSFVATENQTTFSGTDKFGKSLAYNSGEIAVFLNGVKLLANTDYTATNGTTVVLSANTNASDVVEVQSYTKNAGVSNAVFQAWVANTNAYIAASGLIGTVANTYLQAYIANTNLAINDRMQVANATLLINDRMQVANVASAISTAISNLVDSAPTTLDTLNELAAALGDDANFSTTVTNSIASKASWSALTTTNTNIRTLVSDRLQVANASATYATISTFNSALANTNAYIASVAASGGEVSNSYLTSTYVSNTTFQSFVANTNAYIASSGGGGGGVSYVTKTSNYTASSGEGILADTSGGAFTVTLPATPSEGDQVIVADASGSFATNNLTVARNGSTIDSLSEDLLLDTSDASVEFVYDGSTWLFYTKYQGGIQIQVTNNLGIDNKTYTASNGQTTFSVSYANSKVLVYRNGIKISPNEYTANNGTTVVLSTAANEDDAIDLIGYTTQEATEATYTTNTAFQSALANTNAYIASVAANAGDVSNSYLTSTYVSNTTFQSFVANTNAYIASSGGGISTGKAIAMAIVFGG